MSSWAQARWRVRFRSSREWRGGQGEEGHNDREIENEEDGHQGEHKRNQKQNVSLKVKEEMMTMG